MVNELTYTLLPLAKLEVNKGQIEGVPKNPRFIRDNKYKQLMESISNTPEMMKARPLIVHQWGEKYVVLAGNMRLRAMSELKWHECPCAITAEGTEAKKLREYAIKDNVAFGEDDMDLLANEWDLGELQDWGMDFSFNLPKDVHDRSEWAQGEANEEYNDFVAKFAPKLTTDDCYTPPAVYDAVLEWVRKEYGISEDTPIIRPFFPNGDFENYDYIFCEGRPILRLVKQFWDPCSNYDHEKLIPVEPIRGEEISHKVYIYKITPKNKYRIVCP
jgi:hypothetical protein